MDTGRKSFNLNQKTLAICGITFLVLSGFAWFALRPAYIKSKCAIVLRVAEAEPEKVGLPKDQVEECDSDSNIDKFFCDLQTKNVPSKQERRWEDAATDQEYRQCVRSYGL